MNAPIHSCRPWIVSAYILAGAVALPASAGPAPGGPAPAALKSLRNPGTWVVREGGNPAGFHPDSREGQEYDSQGQFVFLVRQYLDFTGDGALSVTDGCIRFGDLPVDVPLHPLTPARKGRTLGR